MLGMLVAVAGVLGVVLPIALPGPGQSIAAAQAGEGGDPVPYTDASVPARDVTMIGSSPGEAPGETWGVGRYNGASVIVRYTTATGWSLAPEPLDFAGQPLAGFKLEQVEGFRSPDPSPQAGEMTPNGSGVLAGTVPGAEGAGARQVVLVREPSGAAPGGAELHGAFKEAAPLPAGLLKEGESLFAVNQAPMLAALEEADGHAGALVVPVEEGGGVDTGVLHWDGEAWTRESIEIPAESSKEFQVLAIGASSPRNAWLIARLSSKYPVGSVALFRRHLGSGGEAATWQPVAPKPSGEPGEPLSVPIEAGKSQAPFTVPSGDQSQILTVTGGGADEGVWIDGVRRDAQASTTMIFKPEGETAGRVLAAWCKLPAGAAAGTVPCQYELPETLPTAGVRSFAWAEPSTPEGFGQRVIAGFSEGVSLRLEGTSFHRVLALGGASAPADVGATFGAAFSEPREGWLGQESLPVHLTRHQEESRLAPWPAAFHDALLAMAAEPGAPVGSLSSEALAVGDQGEVARYTPGKGWLPESLLGPGGRRETPRLRAVAWPTPRRAYAVGDPTVEKLNQMWLWRAETGLWEPDPAEPVNFRGNLLGIAFDPNNPARGYVIGQGGVLLRYGKTWTQEPEAAIPPQARGASFTSIAFAGSEAIIAYRKLPDPARDSYEGGLIVNDGSGWQADQGAAAAIGANVPWTVAGLPDGGAAFMASGSGEGAQIYERESAGAAWQATATPYPAANGTPGSLALFREGGALRVIAAGTEPDTYAVENEPSSPPGFPPTLINPYPLGSDPEHGVMRQTATGWNDEEHDLNDIKEPPGQYTRYDTVYEPDPVATVLVSPSGAQGWAVGGDVETQHPLLDTADVYRYPAEAGAAPGGVGSSPVRTQSGQAVFAIGGGAQCAAPCADRANARIGPDVWMEHALKAAGEVPGARAFLYTGPRVTTGETAGPATLPIPYEQELARYAGILGTSRIPAYAAVSPSDLDGGQNEELFEREFGGFPQPFGEGVPAGGLASAGRSAEDCAGTQGCQAAYYALESGGTGGTVRVIVLDDANREEMVGPVQLKWLAGELAAAKSAEQPAIVVGKANLAAQIQAGGAVGAAAAGVAQVLVCGTQTSSCPAMRPSASAYFFDSPEQNIKLPLRAGSASIPSFGSGTLGYVNYQAEETGAFIGASGFLLAQFDVAARNPNTNVIPESSMSVELIPNVGELAMEAENGTLLQRSHTTLFQGLARRPRAGNRAANRQTQIETDPYIPIPSICVGSACASGLLPEYSFSSSNPSIGGFVKQNLVADPHGREVQLATNGEPVREPINPESHIEESKSGLFCAYNPGTTIVTIRAGGLAYSLPVTVQAGSVREPCGTVPANKAAVGGQAAAVPVPPPAPTPAPAGTAPASSPPVLPVPPAPPLAVTPPPASRPPTPRPPPAPFFIQPAPPFLVPAFVPPPLPAPAEPTPPTGTSAVTSPVEAAQKEEEEEEATESVSNQALAYRAPEHEPSPVYVLGIVALAAFAGATTRKRMRRGRREVRVAPATLTTMRAQRRMSPRRGRLR
jgi:hypothetical protein